MNIHENSTSSGFKLHRNCQSISLMNYVWAQIIISLMKNLWFDTWCVSVHRKLTVWMMPFVSINLFTHVFSITFIFIDMCCWRRCCYINKMRGIATRTVSVQMNPIQIHLPSIPLNWKIKCELIKIHLTYYKNC